MPRRPKPWRRRGQSGDWYAQVRGKQVRLAPAKATFLEAEVALIRLLADCQEGPPAAPGAALTVGGCIRLYLAECQRETASGTRSAGGLTNLMVMLGDAGREFDPIRVMALTEPRVQRWLAGKAAWGNNRRADALAVLKACFNWCVRSRLISSNPIALARGPKRSAREQTLSPEQAAAILRAIPTADPFRVLFVLLRETGCRPNELYSLTVGDVDLSACTASVANKTARQTGLTRRTVYLSETAVGLLRPLVEARPTGAVLRNSKGTPWNRVAVFKRFKHFGTLAGVGPEAMAYGLRHLFATDLLEAGVPPATVATLMGHTTLTQVMRTYSKLRNRVEHLRSSVNLPRSGSSAAPPLPSPPPVAPPKQPPVRKPQGKP